MHYTAQPHPDHHHERPPKQHVHVHSKTMVPGPKTRVFYTEENTPVPWQQIRNCRTVYHCSGAITFCAELQKVGTLEGRWMTVDDSMTGAECLFLVDEQVWVARWVSWQVFAFCLWIIPTLGEVAHVLFGATCPCQLPNVLSPPVLPDPARIC